MIAAPSLNWPCRTLALRAASAVIALILATPALHHASAAETLRLRPEVVVSEDVVTLGDLFDYRGALASRPLFRAPEPGRSGVLSAARIAGEVRKLGVRWTAATAAVGEVVVTRAARTVSLEEIRQAVARRVAVLDPSKAGADLEIHLTRTPAFIVPETVTGEVFVERARYDARTGRFAFVLAVAADAGRNHRATYTGRIEEMVSLPVLRRGVPRGERIVASDIVVERLPRAAVSGDVIDDPREIAAMAARRSLRAGQPLRRRDIEPPELVRKGSLVTITYTVPGLSLALRGRAQQSGAKGDVITVVNPRSRRRLEVEVTGPDAVAVTTAPLPAAAQTASLQR